MEHDTFFINNHRTRPMEEELQYCHSFDEFERRFERELLRAECRVGEYLSQLLDKYDKKAAVVSVDAGFSHGYVGNIINGIRDNPSRDVLICICLTIHATFDEVQYLLKYAGHAPLYVRNRRDVVIWFGIMKGEDVDTVNENLKKRGMEPLYVEKPDSKRGKKTAE